MRSYTELTYNGKARALSFLVSFRHSILFRGPSCLQQHDYKDETTSGPYVLRPLVGARTPRKSTEGDSGTLEDDWSVTTSLRSVHQSKQMPTVAALKLVLPLVLDNNLSLFLFVYIRRCVSLATRGTWRARDI